MSACTGTPARSGVRSPTCTSGSGSGRSVPPSCFQPVDQLGAQLAEGRTVRLAPRPDQHIPALFEAPHTRQDLPPEDLAQPPLQPVPIHDPPTMPRNDQTDTRERDGGSGVIDVQMARPAPLPPYENLSDLRPLRQPPETRKPLRPTALLRVHTSAGPTSILSSPPGACAHGDDGGSGSRGPNASPSGHGTRACSSACGCAGCMSAFPCPYRPDPVTSSGAWKYKRRSRLRSTAGVPGGCGARV